MSGGSFNYACDKVESEDVFQGLSDYRAIEQYLRSVGRHAVADEVYAYILVVETAQRRLATYGNRISPLLHAAEWLASGDWGLDQLDKAFQEFTGETNV